MISDRLLRCNHRDIRSALAAKIVDDVRDYVVKIAPRTRRDISDKPPKRKLSKSFRNHCCTILHPESRNLVAVAV